MECGNNGNFSVDYIDSADALNACIQELATEKELAFDLEFDRNKYSYGFNLCLIQIATANKCFILDPIADIPLTGLFQLFEDSSILKTVHSPGEDLRLLHSLKCYPKNVFDIQIAAKLLNYEQLSLGALLASVLDVQADKKLQTSNWSKRPLSPAQIVYSSNDVIYLLSLKNELLKKATAKNIQGFIEEELQFLDTTIYTDNPNASFLKEAELNGLSDYYQYVLNELLRFRDAKARSANKPPAWIIPNDTVRDIAFGKLTIESFLQQSGIYPGIKNPKFKTEFLAEFETIKNIAKDFSRQPKNRTWLTEEEKQEKLKQKEENEKIRELKFKPIQLHLESIYGTFAAKYILGDGVVGRIIKGESKVVDIKEAYRKQVISKAAADLDIDIAKYL